MPRRWTHHGADALNYLHVDEAEVDVWLDALHPGFDAVTAGSF